MKNLLLLIFGLFFSMSFAQRHEIGVFAGGANVIGDIGKSNYINPMPVSSEENETIGRVPLAFGLLYRFNFNPYMGFRLSGTYGKVIGADFSAPEEYKKERGYTYKNNIIEGALLFEYNFFNINEKDGKKHSPYIFGGIGAFFYDKNLYTVNHTFERDENGVIVEPTAIASEVITRTKKESSFTLPFGAGYKFKYRKSFVLSAEVGFRYTQVDNLDFSFSEEADFTFNSEAGLNNADVNQLNSNFVKSRQVGNTSNHDWYVFTGLTLTYTFGRPPCYCD
ncbi:MAG: DUF6089 family protein [Moheibacter sp.]